MMTLRRMRSVVVPAVVVPAVVVLAVVVALPACSDDEPAGETFLPVATTSTVAPSTTGPPSTTSSTVPATTGPPTTPPPPGPSVGPTPPPPADERVATPQDAVALWVIAQGAQYAGDCAATSLDTDVGKVCSSQYSAAGADVVYIVGPTFSEFTTYLLVSEEASGWYVADTAPAEMGVPPPW
jgi:hypothetical protein